MNSDSKSTHNVGLAGVLFVFLAQHIFAYSLFGFLSDLVISNSDFELAMAPRSANKHSHSYRNDSIGSRLAAL